MEQVLNGLLIWIGYLMIPIIGFVLLIGGILVALSVDKRRSKRRAAAKPHDP